jgi:hypothetical protein
MKERNSEMLKNRKIYFRSRYIAIALPARGEKNHPTLPADVCNPRTAPRLFGWVIVLSWDCSNGLIAPTK